MAKKKILLVQFRTKKLEISQEKKCIERYLRPVKLEMINAFNQKIKFSQTEKILKKFGGVILGGSAFNFAAGNPNRERIFWQMVKRVKPFIQYLIKKDIPTLGICFGHQFLAYLLGVRIVNDKKQQETGSFPVFLTREGRVDPLFFNIPSVFISQMGHKDSLEKLPLGTVILARTKRCKIAAFRYKKNIYGLQFHPELTLKNLISRLRQYPDYTGSKTISDIKKELKSSPHASKIFKNFLKIIHTH